MLRLDLHIHSKYSYDGSMEIEKIIRYACACGLDGIAICDHNAFMAYEQAKSLAPDGFIVIPSVEYSTEEGHVLALFATHEYELPVNERGLRSIEALRTAADCDGAVLIAAHPFRRREELSGSLLNNVCGLEAENSRDTAAKPENSKKTRDAATRYNKFITGGSDAHIAQEIGASFTVFPDNTERTPEGIRTALLRGESDAGSIGSRLRYQALSKLRRTRPRKVFRDMARLIVFTVKDVFK